MSINKFQHKFIANFKCINTSCEAEYSLNEIIYTCSKCGSLLKVNHNLNELKKVSESDWKTIFKERAASFEFPNTSGIWNKREFVLPEMKTENIVSAGEGKTHLFRAKRLAKEFHLSDIFVKQCGVSHTGSFKDLGMTVLVSHVNQLISEGIKIKAVACASTGDTSAALAAYAAMAGIPTIVFLPANKVSNAQLIQPVSNGAKVISLDTDFDGCMKIVQEVSKEAGIYLANSMNSLRIEGQKTISFEISEQLNWQVPDWIIIPGGNLGNVSALGSGYEMLYELGLITKLPRIILAQAENANPLYLSFLTGFKEFKPIEAKKTLASAIQIGNPVSINKAILTLKKFNGIVEQASESELSDASAKSDLYGLYNDPHTGVALAAMFKQIEKSNIKSGDSVVIISTANGLKFTEFKTSFHEQKIPNINTNLVNQIISSKAILPNVMDVVKRIT
jgi:threonine synthase